jgi:transcriptional regulator GlxA family with amidase domain
VSQTAYSCGFSHLGRFSRYYRERFGDVPSVRG